MADEGTDRGEEPEQGDRTDDGVTDGTALDDESADPDPSPDAEPEDGTADDETDDALTEAGYAQLGDSGIASTMAGPAEEPTADAEVDAETEESGERGAEGTPESDATEAPEATETPNATEAESAAEPVDSAGESVEPSENATEPTEGGVEPPVDADTSGESPTDFVPEDVRKYERFKKMDGARYDRVNEFLRDRTYVTAREWAIARLCADFRTETGVEMTKIGEHLPELVPFMTDTYTPQAVNQARHSFEEKVRKSGATFLYGAMSGFFTAEQLDDVMYEITEVAKFLLEVEGVDLSVDEELESEDRILSVMREVRESSEQLRHEGATCPECGHEIGGDGEGH